MDKTETGLIVVGLGVAAFILYKSGVLKTTAKVLDDTLNLPQNIITLAGLIPQIPLAIAQNNATPMTQQSIFNNAIQGKVQTFPGVASITQRVANMIKATYQRYANVTATNWGQVAASHNAIFDSTGNIVSDNEGGASGSNADMSYISAHGG